MCSSSNLIDIFVRIPYISSVWFEFVVFGTSEKDRSIMLFLPFTPFLDGLLPSFEAPTVYFTAFNLISLFTLDPLFYSVMILMHPAVEW